MSDPFKTSSFIFEHGLEIGARGKTINLESASSQAELEAVAIRKYGVQLIARTCELPEPFRILGFARSVQLYTPGAWHQSDTFSPFLNDVHYEFHGARYHCETLAQQYADRCRDFTTVANAIREPDGELVGYTYPELYYEFDAFVSKSRRCIDRVGEAVWKRFVRASDRPGNFVATLRHKSTRASVPGALWQHLSNFWESAGKRVKEYRDNVHHFSRLSEFNSVMRRKIGDDAWGIFVAIPDNPDAKSAKRFTYDGEIDALSYSWTTYNSVGEFVDEVGRAMGQATD